MAKLLVCAGEPSGDLHAARLVKECLQIDPTYRSTESVERDSQLPVLSCGQIWPIVP